MARPQFSEVPFGFDVRSNSPIDRRLVLTWSEMENMKMFNNCGKEINIAAVFPDKYLVICEDNGRLYQYSKLVKDPCNDCAIEVEQQEGMPYATKNGHFTLFTKVTDIVHIKDSVNYGDRPKDDLINVSEVQKADKYINWESIVDECGIAKVCTADELRAIVNEIEVRFKNLESTFDEKADKTEIARLDSEVASIKDLKQDNIIIFGSGDYITSEGLPATKKGSAGFGVHVKYNLRDPSTGKEVGPRPKGFIGDLVQIDHDPVVPAGGWTSEYEFGGVAVGQNFPEGTSLFDVIRQMLMGDPRVDNVICFQVVSELPHYWKEINWAQFTKQRYQLWRYTPDQAVEDGKADPLTEWSPRPNMQYILCAIPRPMLEQGWNTDPGEYPDVTDPDTDITYRNHSIRLDWVANPERPEYKYEFDYYDIPSKEGQTDWTYRVYYLPKATGTLPLAWSFIYTKNIETDQPHKGYPVNP